MAEAFPGDLGYGGFGSGDRGESQDGAGSVESVVEIAKHALAADHVQKSRSSKSDQRLRMHARKKKNGAVPAALGKNSSSAWIPDASITGTFRMRRINTSGRFLQALERIL